MKKIVLCSMAALLALSAVGCNQSSSTQTSAEHAKAVKVRKDKAAKAKKAKEKDKKEHAKKQAEAKKKKAEAAAQKQKQQSQAQQPAQQQQQQTQTQAQQGQQHLTQGQINMMRGYDPNGAPLLPGQDHAAGSNPDGTPDAWVQGQIEWAIQQGYMNPDGTETEKGRELERQFEEDDGY